MMADPDLPERAPIATAARSVLLVVASADRLRAAVGQWRDHLAAHNTEHELLLVDDGTDNQAAAEIRRVAKDLAGPVRALKRSGPPGIGAALREGVAVAQYPLLYTSPPSHPPEELTAFLAAIDGVDIVIGARTGTPRPMSVRVASLVWRGLARGLLGITMAPPRGWLGWQGMAYRQLVTTVFAGGAADLECPCRLYRRAIFEHIPIQSNGPFALAEILAKATFAGCYLDEVELPQPATWYPGDGRWADAWALFSQPTFVAEKPPGPEATAGKRSRKAKRKDRR